MLLVTISKCVSGSSLSEKSLQEEQKNTHMHLEGIESKIHAARVSKLSVL